MKSSSIAAVSTQKSSKETSSKPRHIVKTFYPPPPADLETPWTIKVYSAYHERDRWGWYNYAANQSYAARKLEAVGEEQIIDVDRYPTYFAEATIIGHDLPIGGVRIHLPDMSGRVPLLDELEGFTDTQQIHKMIEELQNEGVSHGGGLWIDPSHARSGLAGDLARASIPMFVASGTRWSVAMGHHRILDAWASIGWLPIQSLASFPFPDDRYRTNVLLCDHNAWTMNIAQWASTQVDDSTLDGSGPRFTVEPMRVGG